MNRLLAIVYLIACVFALMATASCGHAPTVDPAFAPLLTQFDSDAARFSSPARSSGVSVIFGSMSTSETCGQCDEGTNTIIVDSQCWNAEDDTQKQIMLYHELGHCVLHEGHSQTADIMYPSRVSEDIYNYQPDYFLGRLFSAAVLP